MSLWVMRLRTMLQYGRAATGIRAIAAMSSTSSPRRSTGLTAGKMRLQGGTWKEDPSWKTPLEGHARHAAQEDLNRFIDTSERLLVITGAGVSTASGIPDYRGPQGSYKTGHRPISHQEFMGSHEKRQRYWARSIFGCEIDSRMLMIIYVATSPPARAR